MLCVPLVSQLPTDLHQPFPLQVRQLKRVPQMKPQQFPDHVQSLATQPHLSKTLIGALIVLIVVSVVAMLVKHQQYITQHKLVSMQRPK